MSQEKLSEIDLYETGVPIDHHQKDQPQDKSKRDRSRSIRIGKLEIGSGGLSLRDRGSGSHNRSSGNHSGLAKRLSDMFHHNNPHTTTSVAGATSEGVPSVVLDGPVDEEEEGDVEESGTRGSEGDDDGNARLGVTRSNPLPPSFASLADSTVLSDRRERNHPSSDGETDPQSS